MMFRHVSSARRASAVFLGLRSLLFFGLAMASDDWLKRAGDVTAGVVAAAVLGEWAWKRLNVELSKVAWRKLFPADTEQCEHVEGGGLPPILSPGMRYSIGVGLGGRTPFLGVNGDGRTPLPAIDITQAKVARSFLFLYEEHMDLDCLQQGFAAALARFPQVGGVVQMERRPMGESEAGRAGMESHWIEHSDPTVEFVIVRHTAESAPQELQEAELSSVNWAKEPWMPFISPTPAEWPVQYDSPLTRVQVTYFDPQVAHCGMKDVRTAVCIFISHLVADASSVFFFMKEWSAHCRVPDETPQAEPVHDRTAISRISTPVRFFSPERGHYLGWRVRSLIPVLWQLTMRRKAQKEDELKIWWRRFSQRDVDALKAHVRAELGDRLVGHRLSANDVVCALFWKLRMEHEVFPGNRDKLHSRMVVINNARGTIGVPETHFGNGLLFAHTEDITKEMSLAEVAFRVRLMTEAWSDSQRVRDAMELLESVYFRKGVLELATLNPWIDYPTTMLVSNWTKFNATAVDFGFGAPLRFVYPMAAALPGIFAAISYPAGTAAGGTQEMIYEWHYSGSASYHAAVEKFNFELLPQ